MGVACGGCATSRTSREFGWWTQLIGSWLHLEASAAVSAVLESLVTLLVLVLPLVVVCEWVLVLVLRAAGHHGHCPWRHRPEVEVLGLVQLLPILLVLEELVQ